MKDKVRKPRDLVLHGQRVAWCGYDALWKRSVFLNTNLDHRFIFGKPTAKRVANWMSRAGEWTGRG